jgi:hypothetical protein
MTNKGQAGYIGDDSDPEIHIEIDIETIVASLVKNEKFIDSVSSKIRKEMTKDARRLGNLFGPWAGK